MYCVSVSAPEGTVLPDVPEGRGDDDEKLLEESEIRLAQEHKGADSVAVGDGGDGGDDEDECRHRPR